MTTKSATTPTLKPGQARPRAAIAAKTLRTDRWWLAPLLTVIGLGAWVTYATVRVFMHKWYWVDAYHYLTPFYSPCVTDRCVEEASHFGRFLPGWWIIPDAALTLPFLLLFRLTCYYYRKAYYRSFWLSPPACAVAEPHTRYSGETRFPLILQNVHRYFFYLALVLGAILTYDALLAFKGEDGGFGFGLGTLILLANAILIWGYTLGCHSCRNITAGRLNHFSRHPVRYWFWQKVSWLNARHSTFAQVSMYWIMLADLYVLLVANGTISDLRFYN